MKPTDKQIKEFWEGCGFTEVHYNALGAVDEKWSGIPHQQSHWVYLPIDLNNLFKYAVPEDAEVRFRRAKNMRERYCLLVLDESPWEIDAFGETNALALFSALWEVKK